MDKTIVYHSLLNVGSVRENGRRARRITLELTISKVNKQAETVEHETVNEYYTLSICDKQRGQSKDSLREGEWVEVAIPQNDLKQIFEIWDEWHLNDMNAGCIHQTSHVDGLLREHSYAQFQTFQAEQRLRCPNNYMYGSKWLLKVLPFSVMYDIMRVFGASNEQIIGLLGGN